MLSLFFSFFISYSFPSFAQPISQDTLFAQMYGKLYNLNSNGQYEEVITEGEAFLATLQVQDSSLLSYGNVLNVIGTGHYNYGTGDKAFWYTERALAIFTKLNHIRMADAYDRLGECHYWYTQDYDKAIENCQKALAIHEQKSTECTPQKSSVYANIGMIYMAKLNNSEALANYKKALECQNDDADLGRINISIGDFYLRQSLYSQALNYFSKAEIHFKKFYKENKNHPNIASAYANKAICHQNMGAYAKAIIHITKAKQIFDEKLGVNHSNVLKIQAFIGFCYVSQGQYDEAVPIFKFLITQNLDSQQGFKANIFDKLGFCYAMKKQKDSFNTIMPQLIAHTEASTFTSLLDKARVYRNIGVNYRLAKNYRQAAVFYQKALKLIDSIDYKDEKMINLIHLELGNNAFDEGKTDESIEYYEKVLNTHSNKENKKSLEYYYTIYGLSLAYYQKFETAADKTSLNKAIELMDASVNIILELRNDYIEQADKLYLNSDGNIVFDKLIEMLLRKNALEPDANLLKKCFVLSEQNKSMRLLEGIKGVEIGQTSAIVDSIKGAKQTINTLENQIYMVSKEASKNQTEYWKSQLFEAKQEHERFVNTLKTESEQYFKEIYQPKILSIESVQGLLTVHQTLLEYFVGDSSIFIFTVNKDNYNVLEVKKDFALDSLVEAMRTGIYNTEYLKQPDSLVKFTTRYVNAAKTLYDKIIAPVKTLLRGSVVIVPDGALGYIPFDALLKEKPKELLDAEDYKYLLNDHKISYCYSATILKDMVNKKHRQEPTQLFLAMAPYFKGDTATIKLNSSDLIASINDLHPSGLRNGLDSLRHTGEEVTRLQRIMGGEAIIGKGATEDVFNKKASAARIIHLATHGKMDDKVGDYSYLAFTEQADSLENEWLYTRELYNLSLNADMVVLSACETGIGKLQRGEGIISLARAFAYAGAKSIVTTLWQVKDKSTKDIMILFYQNLKKGKAKDDALHQAKLDYIKNQNGELALPYYWSGIIPIGDMRPIGKR